MVLIDFVEAREILDSRGYPTVEARVVLNDGRSEISSVPSGVTKSTFEAIELRDADASRYSGQGVLHAVKNINEIISPRMKKMNPLEQYNIDKVLNELDQTPNKAHLGSNATLAVSQAVAKVAAIINEKPLWSHINDLLLKTRAKNAVGEEAELLTNQRNPKLPIPLMNMYSGGKHSHSQMPFQEFLVVPIKGRKPSEQVQMGAHIRHNIEHIFLEKGIFCGDSIEGGLTANINDVDLILQTLLDSIKNVGLKIREDIALGLDISADYIDGFNPAAYVEVYKKIINTYPIVFLEDPLPSKDLEAWIHLRKITHKQNVFLVGDDLIATNKNRLLKTVKEKAVDMITIKPNQVGTVTETLETAKIAKHHIIGTIVSCRSGETADTFITDLAVGIGADYLKAGAPVRSERAQKYNRLTKIYEENNWGFDSNDPKDSPKK